MIKKKFIPILLAGLMAMTFYGCGDQKTTVAKTIEPVALYATVTGRTMKKQGPNYTMPLAIATVYSYYSGAMQTTTSDSDGFWTLSNVPVGAGDDDTNTNDHQTITVYFTMTGWTAPSSQEVEIGNIEDANQTNFNVDIGMVSFLELDLLYTSNIIHPNDDKDYWQSGIDVDDEELYLINGSTNITITFNMPVDTTYTGTTFVELFDINGDAVTYTGTWGDALTVFTMVPDAALTQDNDDDTKYQLRFIHNVRALNGATALEELNGVSISFNVLLPGAHDALLASQAPVVYPKANTASSYVMDSTNFFTRKIYANSSEDFINDDASGTGTGTDPTDGPTKTDTPSITWNAVAGADEYRVYKRDHRNNTTPLWVQEGADIAASTVDAEGKFTKAITAITDFYAGAYYEYVVTAIDSDGNESSIGEVTTPLRLADAYGPKVTDLTYSADTTDNYRDLDNTVTADITTTFHEKMDTTTAGAAPVLTALSGMMSIVDVATDNEWDSMTAYTAKNVAVTLALPTATLSYPAFIGDTVLFVADVSTFSVGDEVVIYDNIASPSVKDAEKVTITAINSISNTITTDALTKEYTTSAMLYLYNSGITTQLSQFTYTTSLVANQGATTITLTDSTAIDALRVLGESFEVFSIDDNGLVAETGHSVTLEPDTVVAGTTVTLSTPLTFDIAAGAILRANGLALDTEPTLRAGSDTTLAEELVLDSNSINTTIDAEDESDFNTRINVSSTAGFGVGDMVQIAASSLTDTTEADIENNTAITLTAHGFHVNDKVVVVNPKVAAATNNTAVTNNTDILAGANQFILNTKVIVGDNLVFTDAAVETSLSAAVLTAGTSITLAAISNVAVGDVLRFDDGINVDADITVQNISGTTITVNNVSFDFDTGTRVSKDRETETVSISVDNGTSVATTVTVGVNFVNSFSEQSTVYIDRVNYERTITAETTNTITLSSAVYAPSGNAIQLLSVPEVKRVTTVEGSKVLVFNTALDYSHYEGAAVAKLAQYNVRLATLPAGMVVGDTLVIDRDTDVATVNDRFSATITDIDTTAANPFVTVTTTATGIAPATATVHHMGDAFVVSGATDNSGNAMQTTAFNRANTSIVK